MASTTCAGVNNSNGTVTESDEKNQALYVLYNVMIAVITISIMFSMGTSITFKGLKAILRRPIGPIIGFICQCILLPATCFGYAIALDLAPNLAIGMLMTGCCPGGTISNICSFWAKADICLSMTMTTISTTLAIGFLPLNMFIYSRYWVDDPGKVPYVNMVTTILYLWVAVIAGFFLGRKWPRVVPYFTKIGSVFSFALILGSGFVQNALYPELFEAGWEAWYGAFTLPIIGFLLGFILATLCGMKHQQRLAIGIETSLQNTALALTIIAFTYPSSVEASCYSQFILLYTSTQVAYGVTTVIVMWFYYFMRYRETPCATAALQEDVKNRTAGIHAGWVEDGEEERQAGEGAEGTGAVGGVAGDGEPGMVAFPSDAELVKAVDDVSENSEIELGEPVDSERF